MKRSHPEKRMHNTKYSDVKILRKKEHYNSKDSTEKSNPTVIYSEAKN